MAFDESERDDLLDRLVEEFAARLRRGERPALKEYTDRYPDLADEIRELFPAMAQVEQAKEICHDWDEADRAEWADADTPPPAQIGDYRIAREIGRGGMGVVYEAEQVSLGRRVALKVLPTTPGRDGTALARFRREARALARLHHTNIVPVFDVGQDGDIRYYAMQFIQGESLDLVIRELRKLRDRSRRVPGGRGEERQGDRGTLEVDAEVGVVHSLLTGQFHGGSTTAHAGASLRSEPGDPAPPQPDSPAAADTSAVMPGGTQLSSVESRHRAFHRGVAQIGRQVASALAYAHTRGILHRDIKPSNLLLDTEGVVWVSDFGLAKVDDDELTKTGDILGTLRYMAPERFRGQGDARADLYSLGLTLYELLTFRPAFDSPDRLALSEQIKTVEPPRPRSIDPRVSRDLETILLKAIEKDPGHRYATAEAMAEDLRRFLDDEPILARRASAPERYLRWARRHPALAILGGALTAVLIAVTIASVLVAGRMAALAAVNEREKLAAEAAQVQADHQRDRAEGQRTEADRQRERAEQHLYIARIGRAESALRLRDSTTARGLLDLSRPAPGEPDRRGWEWHYLDHWCEPELRKLALPGGASARCLTVSPDGCLLAVGCWDINAVNAGTYPPVPAYLISLPDGQVRHELTGHNQVVDSVAFRPDGKCLATIGARGTVQIWDTGGGRLLRTINLGTTGERTEPGLSWSPDGQRLATVTSDGVVGIWDPDTGRQSARLIQKAGSIAWSPDGTRIALGRIDDPGVEVRPWDARSERAQRPILMQAGEVNAISWSPDGRRLAVTWEVIERGSHRGRLTVCDATSGEAVFQVELVAVMRSIAFSSDGTRLATGGEEGTVRVFDAADGREHAAPLTGATHSSGLAFSPDGRRLYAAGWGSSGVKVFDPTRDPRGRRIAGWPSQISALTFDHEGLRILGINWQDVGRLYSADPVDGTVRIDRMFSVTDARRYPRGDFAFSPDARWLAAPLRQDRTKVGVWDRAIGRLVVTLRGSSELVTAVAFGRGGRSLATAAARGPDGRPAVTLWDLPSGRAIRTLAAGPDPIEALTVSGDGRRLAAGWGKRPEAAGGVAAWDTETGAVLGTLDRVGTIMSLAFHPDGDRIAIADFGETKVRLWDLAAGTLITHPGPAAVSCVGFTPDGKRLAALGYDGDVVLADARTGDEVLVLRGFGPPHGSGGHTPRLAFSPDGTQLAATATDDTLNVWDLGIASGVEIEPGDGDVVGWLHRTRALAERDDAAGAAAAFARADKIPGGDASPWIKHAVWLWRRGETAQARDALNRALELLPDDPGRWTDMGRLLARFGRITEFETVLAKARSLGERRLAREPGDESAAAVVADLLPDSDESSVWTVLDPVMMASAQGATLTRLPDGSVLAGGRNPLVDTYTIEARTSLARITALRLEALPHPALLGTGPGRSNDSNFMMDGIRLITMSESAGAVPVSLTHARADFWQANEDIVAPSGGLVAGSARAWGIWPRVGRSHWAVFQAARPCENAAGTSLRVELAFRTRLKYHTLGRFRLSVTDRPFPQSLARLHLQAIKADTERAGLKRLGAAYSLLGDWTSAAAVLTRAAARSDGSALDNVLLAMAHRHLGQLDEARSACDRALARFGSGLADDATGDMAIGAIMTIRGLNATEAEGLLLDQVFPADPFGPL